MDLKDIKPMESVAELLSQGWIILEKDGIIKKVDKVSHGSVEIHFRDGVPYKKTEHVNGLI
ncbi:hypothetical protein KP735_02765 [Streptococcus equi subsp. zooepidemicus]|uniref:hypothetical protein n=1 Tax=Streptococcus TaxID=1301 RepID=UPI0010C3B027|nr:hypothetical protein [Streptococcus equi]MCD3394728.1 hypothetical protein [Streptococcus equi subsp. zooepidemicus]MCD3450278.1 hypothetical protein [Streptococcus equi subsp. zooepidemicus]WOK57920.1 hypothetical protein RIM63_03880 [Streptococcus equi subsp. zooepidemicus]VTP88241.1 Uncharacterised protein [Streptococcus equi subsp. zooepidemicus]HEK9995237.1 hypothetical protein [Streptococcus equi subsp. zooepidemicus]